MGAVPERLMGAYCDVAQGGGIRSNIGLTCIWWVAAGIPRGARTHFLCDLHARGCRPSVKEALFVTGSGANGKGEPRAATQAPLPPAG